MVRVRLRLGLKVDELVHFLNAVQSLFAACYQARGSTEFPHHSAGLFVIRVGCMDMATVRVGFRVD